MATQNPVETEGTYPLPEAQVDRFMMKVLVTYPSDEEEFIIAERAIGAPAFVQPVATTEQLAAMQRLARQVYVDPSIIQYAVRLVSATRQPQQHGLADIGRFITYGASPRATINLVEGARALALMRRRSYVLPEDLTLLVPDVLRHRIAVTYEALSEGISPDDIVARIMSRVAPPAKPIQHDEKIAA